MAESREPARAVAAALAELPQVEAIAVGGSGATGKADPSSDVDLYVYCRAEIALARRAAIAGRFSPVPEVGNSAFEPGDEWTDAATGVRVDVMYRSPTWIEAQLDAVLVEHRATVGYSTCFWWNVRTSSILFDRDGWFGRLQERASVPYPEPLRRAIVAKNHPLLRSAQSSFLRQVELALRRDDPVAVQHRTAALLASYFDVLFAVDRIPHPGEKRLLTWAEELCPGRPPGMAEDVRAVLLASAAPGGAGLIERLHAMLDRLDDVLRTNGLLAAHPL